MRVSVVLPAPSGPISATEGMSLPRVTGFQIAARFYRVGVQCFEAKLQLDGPSMLGVLGVTEIPYPPGGIPEEMIVIVPFWSQGKTHSEYSSFVCHCDVERSFICRPAGRELARA